jgi:predicted enzyme related to lactoylglutathione lyase
MAQGTFHGRFVWQELMTEDTGTAGAFYSKVVGWRAQPSSVDPTYTQFGIGSAFYAGMMKLPDEARAAGAKPQWLPYIGAADVEATMAAAERLGGRVVRPAHDIPTVGRFAILADPQGAAFAVFKPAQDGMVPPAEPPLGGFAWMELATSNHEAAFDFYSKLFGWQALHRMDMGPQGVYLIFGSDGMQRGGMYKLQQERSSKPYWLAYANVPSADAAAAAATAAGGRVLAGPMEVPGGGRMAQVIDPNGAMFAVHSAPAKAPAAPAPSKPAAATPPAPKPAPAKPAEVKPAAPKPAPAPTAAKPAAAPAKPAAITPPAPKPAPTLKPATASPAPKKAAAKKAAPKKAAAKKPAAKKKAAKKKKPAASKPARKKAHGKKAAARKSAAKSAKKSVRKSARKAAKKSKGGKRKPAKARRKK